MPERMARMADIIEDDAFGTLVAPKTLEIRRVLPGPVERVWAYLTDGELRRQWLAAGDMDLKAGSEFTFHWRNDTLTDPPGNKPEGFSDEEKMTCRIVEAHPPRKLVITWGEKSGTVSFTLEPRGDKVLLTLVHSELPDRGTLLDVSAGWHTHLDILVARASQARPPAFWDHWVALKQAYSERLK